MENCCRTCLSEKKEMKLLSTKWKTTSFAAMLIDTFIMTKEITSDETLLKICSSCESDLITAHNFKIVCQNTDKILSERFATKTISLSSIEEIKSEIINEDSVAENKIEINTAAANESKMDCTVELQKITSVKSTKVKPSRKIVRSKKQTEPKKNKTERKSTSSIENENTEPTISSNDRNSPPLIVKPRRNRHKNRKPCLYCRKCDMRFEKETLYRKHCEQTHWQTYPCSICGKIFLQNRIVHHMKIHVTERNYICTVCGGTFTTPQNLRDHSRIHTGEKRYKCEFCDETFVHWNSRKNHIYKIHTREKKYECYICHRLFAQRGTMVKHIKYHIGDLNHACSHCDKRFPTKFSRKRHELTHFKNRKKYDTQKSIFDDNIVD